MVIRSFPLRMRSPEQSAVGIFFSGEDISKAKYLQDILAAQKSRKRELEYVRELENERKEKEMKQARTLAPENLLRDNGQNRRAWIP